MSVYKEKVQIKSHGGTPTFVNITKEVRQAIANSGIRNGIVTAISPHTTCSVFFEEYVHDTLPDGTEYLQRDLNKVLQSIIPDQVEAPSEATYLYPGEKHYEAVEAWPDAASYLPGGDRTALFNCDAHLKATMLGNSTTLEVEDGKLAVGPTGYVYFVDFDRAKGRNRRCSIVVIGE